jgi:hypothetical protein
MLQAITKVLYSITCRRPRATYGINVPVSVRMSMTLGCASLICGSAFLVGRGKPRLA